MAGQVLFQRFYGPRSIKTQKKNKTNIQPPWPRAWSLIIFFAKVKARFGFLFFYFLTDREITEIFLQPRKIFCEKNTLVHLLGSDDTSTITYRCVARYIRQHFDLQHVPCGPPYHSSTAETHARLPNS